MPGGSWRRVGERGEAVDLVLLQHVQLDRQRRRPATPAVTSPSIQRFGRRRPRACRARSTPSTITVPRSGSSMTSDHGTAATASAWTTSMVRACRAGRSRAFSREQQRHPDDHRELGELAGLDGIRRQLDPRPRPVDGRRRRRAPGPGSARRSRRRTGSGRAIAQAAVVESTAAPIASTRPMPKFSACRSRKAYWLPSVSAVRLRASRTRPAARRSPTARARRAPGPSPPATPSTAGPCRGRRPDRRQQRHARRLTTSPPRPRPSAIS